MHMLNVEYKYYGLITYNMIDKESYWYTSVVDFELTM